MKTGLITIVVLALAAWAIIALTNKNSNEIAVTSISPSQEGYGSSASPSPSGRLGVSATVSLGSKQFDLNEKNGSNEDGTVTVSEVGGKTKIEISLTHAPSTAQAVRLYAGSCSAIGILKYALNSVVNGVSTTTLNLSLAQFKAMGSLALDVRQSAGQANTSVACADVRL